MTPIDKSWTKIKNRTSPEFIRGLKEFMEYAKNSISPLGYIKCPCRKCKNVLCFKPNIVYGHIHDKGFDENYSTWCFHGESYPPRQKAPPRQAPTPSCCTDPDKWNAYIDFHLNEKQQSKSVQNSKNRRVNTLPTCEAYSFYLPSDRIEEGMSTQISQQNLSEDSSFNSSSSTPSLTPHDEIVVMQAVLKKPRRDFTVGIGRRLPGGSRDAPESSSSGIGALLLAYL